jgi:hypothetical protein
MSSNIPTFDEILNDLNDLDQQTILDNIFNDINNNNNNIFILHNNIEFRYFEIIRNDIQNVINTNIFIFLDDIIYQVNDINEDEIIDLNKLNLILTDLTNIEFVLRNYIEYIERFNNDNDDIKKKFKNFHELLKKILIFLNNKIEKINNKIDTFNVGGKGKGKGKGRKRKTVKKKKNRRKKTLQKKRFKKKS